MTANIRSYRPADSDWMLALNRQFEAEMAPLDAAQLASIIATSFYVGIYGAHGGFITAIDSETDYDNENFLWHKQRRSNFVYVDRIVVAADYRGLGVGRQLYQELFRISRHAGFKWITAEVNLEPPNPGSDRFHASMGFVEVGRTALPKRRKEVRFIECAIEQ